jgi:subtilisin family serine protease
MRTTFEIQVPDADVYAFEQRLARRLEQPASVLQAIGGERYLLARHVAKRLFPGTPTAAILKALRGEGARGVRAIKAGVGSSRLAARAEPEFVPRFMAAAPATLPGEIDWHLREVNLPAAWDALGGVDGGAWASIRVGHIDTGYTEQPALGPWQSGTSPVVRTDLDGNYFDRGGEDPLSALEPGHADGFPFHGTRTLCTLAGRDANAPDRPFFGAAPGAQVVPIRDTNSILVDDQQKGLAAAIHHVVDAGCRVMTISQGITLFPLPEVKAALAEAYENGVIVVAAAGQHFFGVVAPARLRHSIAVAGTIPGLNVWQSSCSGPQVDISAPAEPIRVASAAYRNGYSFPYGESSGTSYATPLVAGTAALWFARWGASLDTAYTQKWQRVAAFLHVLRTTAQRPSGWNTQRHGAGVLDAAAVVAEPLPAASTLQPE